MLSIVRALFYPTPKVGEVYAWETEDPFVEPDLHTVLETKRGWVKFKRNSTGTEFTVPLWIFHIDYIRVRKP